jgi:pimeloyl-ACP methyl ester carboxylesterase
MFLDEVVHVGSVAVVGFSYGAPAAVEFARRHPERTRALVLISPVLKRGDNPEQRLPKLVNEGLTGDMGSWLAVKAATEEPGTALGWAFDLTQQGGDSARAAWTNTVQASPEQLAWFRQLVGTLAPINPRETGLRNDLLQMHAIPEIPYEKIGTPTLIVHGAGDRFVSAADVLDVSKRMPRAEVFNVEGAGHLVQLGPNAGAVRGKIASFLKQFNGAAN